ncbi:Afadin [Mizuhopecten yessoensis]|uniref:Afadin n=1 Tax=Mizuhopecten yessoensis TaxID=6573 RepID=A0A210Q2K6_MIZYE|nr:Afadin [Mizuhopecten yessoensis]
MAGSGGALNLSLLSRGVGEVSKNGHEKVEVLFEPQDYYNFRTYLPPIEPPTPTYAYDSSPTFSRRSHKPNIPIPKTFTTRKGALLLFSEDLAHKNPVPVVRRHNYHSLDETKFSSITPGDEDGDLKTVDDLAKSILLYGNQDSPDLDGGFMNMKFIRGRKKKDYFDRQIRPGFSAKRYLSSWTKSWDDSVLEKVISKGYLTEKSLFYYNPLMPHLQRRLNDDMSHYPVPYKLMRSMLMSPGSLSGYTFYRVRPESAETILTQEDAGVAISRGASIKVISTKDGIQREVTYASLDRHAKEEVLTDLLVKSAVHYAMKKQQEYMDGTHYSKVNKIIEVPESPVPKFDMQDAVESLLDGQKKKNLLDTDFVDDKSSEHSGSFKGKTRRSRGSKGKRSLGSSRDDKEYIGNVPVVAMRAGDSSPTTLPHISGTLPLPPIGEASREQTNIPPVVLPPIGNEADMADGVWGMGDNDILRQKAMDLERRRKEEKLRRRRGEGPSVSGGSYLQSSSESLGAGSGHSVPAARPVRNHWKGSNQSLRSIGSKKGSGDEGSLKGSVIFGPDGQVINVGGAIQPSPRLEATGMIDQVTDANRFFGKGVKKPAPISKDLVSDESDDEPDEWKHSKALRRREVMRREGSVKSQISEEDIVNALTEHAQQVAASVLSSKPETGNNLEADVRQAAEMWMEKHPPRQISRSHSIQDNHDTTVIDEIIEMRKQKRKSAGPTAGEYRELIRESLTTAMKAQGLNENIPDDTEITQAVIEALTNGSLTPDDLELVHDSDSGKSIIRSRSQMANAMGGVKEGHIYVTGSKNGKKAPGSIPVDRTSNVDVGEFDVIKYGTAASQSGSEKAPSEKAMSEKAMSEKAPSEKAPSEKIGKSQPPSIMGESIVEEPPEVVESDKKSSVSFQSEVEPQVDEFKKAVEVIEEQRTELELEPQPPVQEEPTLPDEQKSDISKKTDEKSTRSAKSRVSDKKSKVSDSTSQKGKSELEKREEFVVGKVKQTNELEQLYGPVDPPAKEPTQPPEPGKPNFKGELEKLFGKLPANKEKEKGKPKEKKTKASPPLKKPKEKPKKGKGKGKAKKEEEKEPEPPPKEPTPPPPPKEPTPPPPEVKSDAESERRKSIFKSIDFNMKKAKSKESILDSYKSEEESDFEFNIVRDSPSPEPIPRSLPSLPSYDDNTETENEDDEEDDEAARLRQISNREARAAKRAAQAEKRRQEVDRRRRERDEQSKREKEEWERQELLKQELEEARKRNEENRRRRREAEAEENEQELLEEQNRQKALQAEQEREKRRREEYQRKLEEMKKKQILEEQKRHEESMKKMKEEEERRLAEEEMMAKMAQEERVAYEEKKRREEEERKRKEEEERIKREEEAKKAMEEARKLAEEMARRQAELEARLKFNHTIQVESSGMTHSQSMTRAFVFSYYELLSWLGLDIPEFELLKLNQSLLEKCYYEKYCGRMKTFKCKFQIMVRILPMTGVREREMQRPDQGSNPGPSEL